MDTFVCVGSYFSTCVYSLFMTFGYICTDILVKKFVTLTLQGREPFTPCQLFFPALQQMFPKVLHITMCACSDVLETNVNKCFHLVHQLHCTRQHLFTWECTLHATCSHLFPFVCPSIFLICTIFGTLCAWITPARQVMQIAYHFSLIE